MGFRHPYGHIWPCQPEYKHPQNDEHGLPTISLPLWHVGRGIHMLNDRRGSDISGPAEAVGLIHTECKAELATRSLQTHRQTQQGVVQGWKGGAHTYTHPRKPTTTAFPSQRLWKWFGARWRGVGVRQWVGPTSRSILCTTTCGTYLWYYRRVTYPTPNDPNALFWPVGTSTAATPPLSSVGGERNTNNEG